MTLAGFYGITPRVNILLKEIGQPIDSLAFVLIMAKTLGKYAISLNISDPEGKSVLTVPSSDLEFKEAPPGEGNLQIVFKWGLPVFAKTGKHTLRFSVDGSLHYETTFLIGQASPEQFTE